jgi:nitroreductase
MGCKDGIMEPATNRNLKGEHMNFLELAEKRYSALNYETMQIEEEKLNLILRAGQLAPTACNFQPQRILVITEPEKIELIHKVTKSSIPFGAAMLVCFDKEKCWHRKVDGKSSGEIDASIVTTHMMMEATELGLGSIWVMSWNPKDMKEAFEIPGSYEPVALLVLGYLSEDATVHSGHFHRNDISTIAFWNEF